MEDVESVSLKKRQVIDIPKIELKTTEFRQYTKICSHCNKKVSSDFPENVTHKAQYGPNIKGLIVNLNVYQALPYQRLEELLSDVFSLKISQGTIYNTLKKAYTSLESVENFFKEELIKAAVAHADETGTKVNGKLNWIHSISSELFTVLTSHTNRGKKAIIDAGVIPNFKGILSA